MKDYKRGSGEHRREGEERQIRSTIDEKGEKK